MSNLHRSFQVDQDGMGRRRADVFADVHLRGEYVTSPLNSRIATDQYTPVPNGNARMRSLIDRWDRRWPRGN